MSIIPTLSSEALKDIIQTMAKFKKEGPKSRKRGTAVSQLSLLYDVTKSHIYAIVKNAQNEPQAAITEAPAAPMAVNALDIMSELIEMQINLADWTRRNENYSIKLHTIAQAIDTAIKALESAQALMSLEEENQDLHNKLQNADNQLTVLQDLIDKEREDRRRGDARQTHGE